VAIELPGEVVSFLQFIEMNWPNVNEDKVRELASHMCGTSPRAWTHPSGLHRDDQAAGRILPGASYEALLAKRAQLSNGHMSELIQAWHTVATALDVAADVIVGMKVGAIAELAVLAATFTVTVASHAEMFRTKLAGLQLRGFLGGVADGVLADGEQVGQHGGRQGEALLQHGCQDAVGQVEFGFAAASRSPASFAAVTSCVLVLFTQRLPIGGQGRGQLDQCSAGHAGQGGV
jgi:hypothetical protein